MAFTISHFGNFAFLLQISILIIFGTATVFPYMAANEDIFVSGGTAIGASNILHVFFSHLMVLVGFAYLFVTSARYSWSSIGLTLLYVEMVLQWAQLTTGFWNLCEFTRLNPDHSGWNPIEISISSLADAIYIALAVQISLGACWGRISATQGLAIAFFETVFATANVKIGEEIEINDAGGACFIHVFGAAFGLACSFALSSKANPGISTNAPRSRAVGAFGLVGTLIIVVTLPFFNAFNQPFWIKSILGHPNTNQETLIIDQGVEGISSLMIARSYFNTVFAIASSTMGAFIASRAAGGKFSYAHIQTAVLAGGSAVGACSGMLYNPWGAQLLGLIVGAFTVYASSAFSASSFGIYDAQGALQNHLLPGLIGSWAAGMAAASATAWVPTPAGVFNEQQNMLIVAAGRNGVQQGGYQVAYGCISLAFGVIAGIVTGYIVNLPIFDPKNITATEDSEEWDIAEEGASKVAAPEPAQSA